MYSEYIRIAVSHILSEYDGGKQRCCGSCNPSCDDLTRFICFGHTMQEVEKWINENPELLRTEYEKWFDEIDCPEPCIEIEIKTNEDFPFA